MELPCVLPTTGKNVTLKIEQDRILLLNHKHKPLFIIPTLHILAVHLRATTIHLSYLSPAYTLLHLVLQPTPASLPALPEFIAHLHKAAYPSTEPNRRILLLVNPVGGKGKARKITDTIVLPILKAAGCEIRCVYTTKNGHAKEIANELDVGLVDVIGCVSGDGAIHEVYAGFASRSDAKKCFRVPVVPVPAGSGNALSLSLHGKIDGFSPHIACLNLVKGKPMVMDLCTLTQGDKPKIMSFLSTALGVMADIDLGTENLRWMGDARFVYGFLKATVFLPSWPGTISLLPASPSYDSKQAHADSLRARLVSTSGSNTPDGNAPEEQEEETDPVGPLPEVKYNGPGEGWVTMGKGRGGVGNEGIMYVYAGLHAAASRDLLQWPFVEQGSGLIDVVVQELAPRAALVKAIAGAEDGGQIWQPSQHYFKARAFHVDPFGSSSATNLKPLDQFISIDGEALDPAGGPFTVECHRGLGRTLALRERWEGGEGFWKKGYLDDA